MFDTSMPWLHEPSTKLSFPFLSFSSTTTEVTRTHHSPFSIHTPSTSNILKLPKLTATQVRRPVKDPKITARPKGLTFQLIDRLAILAAYSKVHTHKLPLHIGSSQISLLWIFVCKLAFLLPWLFASSDICQWLFCCEVFFPLKFLKTNQLRDNNEREYSLLMDFKTCSSTQTII